MTDPQQPPQQPPSKGIYYGPNPGQPPAERGTAGKAAIGTVSVIGTLLAICVGIPLAIFLVTMVIGAIGAAFD